MKIVQKVLKVLLPSSTLEKMKAESNQWQLRCTGCGQTKPLWEAGGIRFKKAAVGGFSATFIRCQQCEGLRIAIVERILHQQPTSHRTV